VNWLKPKPTEKPERLPFENKGSAYVRPLDRLVGNSTSRHLTTI